MIFSITEIALARFTPNSHNACQSNFSCGVKKFMNICLLVVFPVTHNCLRQSGIELWRSKLLLYSRIAKMAWHIFCLSVKHWFWRRKNKKIFLQSQVRSSFSALLLGLAWPRLCPQQSRNKWWGIHAELAQLNCSALEPWLSLADNS